MLDELLARHESLFLAIGMGRGRDLDLPGHDLDGVLRAVEFLLNVNWASRCSSAGGSWSWAAGTSRSTRRAPRCRATAGQPDAGAAETASSSGTREDARRGMVTTLDVARAAVRAGVLDVTVIALGVPRGDPCRP